MAPIINIALLEFGPASFAIGLVGGIFVFAGVVALAIWIDERKSSAAIEFQPAVDAGSILCCYVDKETLQSVAGQKGLAPPPKEIEDQTDTEGEVRWRLFKFGRRNARRVLRHPVYDPNALVPVLLRKLEDAGILNRELDLVRSSLDHGGDDHGQAALDFATQELEKCFPDDAHASAPLREIAGEVRDALARFPMQRLVDAKREEFEHLGHQQHGWLLVEGTWMATAEGDAVVLQRTHLQRFEISARPSHDMSSSPTLIDMPSELGIRCRVRGELTPLGLREFHLGAEQGGREVRTGVFGHACGCSDGHLEIEPIAVFLRQP